MAQEKQLLQEVAYRHAQTLSVRNEMESWVMRVRITLECSSQI